MCLPAAVSVAARTGSGLKERARSADAMGSAAFAAATVGGQSTGGGSGEFMMTIKTIAGMAINAATAVTTTRLLSSAFTPASSFIALHPREATRHGRAS
jgi:hypothetical protein